MRSLLLLPIAVSGLLVMLGGGDAFVPRPFIAKQVVNRQPGDRKSMSMASASRKGPSSELPRQQAWLADLVTSWFKLTPPDASAGAKANTPVESEATDEVRATIRELRDSNDDLKAEVLTLRTYMLQRGVKPVEDFFADPSPKEPTALLSSTVSQPPPPPATADRSFSEPTPNTPPPALPREARLAALVLLWAAAVSVGGVFVPIAIREGAMHSLRWLDDGGTLIPTPARRVLGGLRGRWRRKGWSNAVLSYVPVLARAPKAVGEGGDGQDEEGLSTGEGLAGAWGELKPRKRGRRRAP